MTKRPHQHYCPRCQKVRTCDCTLSKPWWRVAVCPECMDEMETKRKEAARKS